MKRLAAFTLTVFVTATATLFGGVSPVAAAPVPRAVTRVPAQAPDQCTTEEWRNPSRWDDCVSRLQDLSADRVNCVKAPTPSAPDSGMAGWFASPSDEKLRNSGRADIYTKYGYAGYNYTTYDIGCVQTVMHPDHKFENTVANGELLLATSTIGASNALREKAWEPGSMWGWADPLVETATKAVYEKVFTVFGAVTLAIVGLYLLWRSRQSDMSATTTTAGWAILVMVAVTAVASWPTTSSKLADGTLTMSLAAVHGAVGPPDETIPPDKCRNFDPNACKDIRLPAQRASDTVTEGLLYRNWLRGLFGTADSETAKRYGPIMYDAKSLSWDEAERTRNNPSLRQEMLDKKAKRWMKVAEQIKKDDPEAYEYLQGTRGMDRVGAGFIAFLAALFFGLFDIVASLLVLLGFLIFRWAVIAAPVLGTIGLLRPASGGIRRLVNAVVAAIFNIIIFGTGAAVYLLAVSLIIKTEALAGWLQVVLILLTGVVGWLLLRPYRRITQLGGKDSSRVIATFGARALFVRHSQENEPDGAAPGGRHRTKVLVQTEVRPEARSEDTTVAAPTPQRAEDKPVADTPTPQQARPTREWTEPDDEEAPQYAIYRPTPRSAPTPSPTASRPEAEPARR
jgi:hypothetical protein